MTLETALRLLDIGLALAVLQRGAEHAGREPLLFLPQLALAAGLLAGAWPAAMLAGMWALGLAQLARFRGPYNGGADKMLLLGLTCTAAARLLPGMADVAVAYLAVQVVLSYAVSGWVKLRNPDWRNGTALSEVFGFSAYPVSSDLRALGSRPRLMAVASAAVIGFELAFPLALLTAPTLFAALAMAAAFHLANAVLFGLNRFLWAWLAAYPAVIWFQGRILG
ncbi:HTTM domain-containing protein [Rhodobacterales bacterium HKCCE2091]|nr:HTTM domain-containing protein [Rhodobacterales bacterium HKCCE2091]